MREGERERRDGFPMRKLTSQGNWAEERLPRKLTSQKEGERDELQGKTKYMENVTWRTILGKCYVEDETWKTLRKRHVAGDLWWKSDRKWIHVKQGSDFRPPANS